NFRSSGEAAGEVAGLIEGSGKKALLCKANVADTDEVKTMVDMIKTEMGGIDILVNNAGIVKDGLVTRMSRDDWDEVINTNLTGAYNCMKAVIPLMVRKRWGRIINISSVVAQIGNPGQANYVASKAGLLGLTKSLAREYSSRNILVNAISPGYIQTDMTKIEEENLKKLEPLIPLGRIGQPEEVAGAAVFLATSATYTTGAVIDVSGGLVM
ncbi:MAG: 3-oxoacyl-ACP reductase FabG, partial [Actinobacteria bacterium]|nr:3-oxoacyl-ACP reductase FabG [Actinomycetota bacterium]